MHRRGRTAADAGAYHARPTARTPPAPVVLAWSSRRAAGGRVNIPGQSLIVTSFGVVTINGAGFGQQCVSCQLLLSGNPIQAFSWTDSAGAVPGLRGVSVSQCFQGLRRYIAYAGQCLQCFRAHIDVSDHLEAQVLKAAAPARRIEIGYQYCMASLWITYAWADNGDRDVDFLAQELGRAGLIVRLDRWSLPVGQRLWDHIADFITNPAQSDGWAIYATAHSLRVPSKITTHN